MQVDAVGLVVIHVQVVVVVVVDNAVVIVQVVVVPNVRDALEIVR